jgi:hypothetical protein
MYERSVRWFQAHEREIIWKELREGNRLERVERGKSFWIWKEIERDEGF